jgi:hypothetical protein
VLDPFAGSCVTGEVCERLNRKWTCVELIDSYLEGATGRFLNGQPEKNKNGHGKKADKDPFEDTSNYYRIPRPGILWNGQQEVPLVSDGGRKRPEIDGSSKESK